MTSSEDQPFLHVDDDWKAQAQAEKARLVEQEKTRTQKPAAEPTGPAAAAKAPASGRRIPPADFQTLVSGIASQALFAMGAMPDPQTGQRYSDLDIARHHIDTLGVLETKTKGNLSEEETRLLAGTLYELRSTYVQIANASRSPATGGQGG